MQILEKLIKHVVEVLHKDQHKEAIYRVDKDNLGEILERAFASKELISLSRYSSDGN